MSKKIVLTVVLSASLGALGGCASSPTPTYQSGRDTPADFQSIPSSNMEILKNKVPTQYLAMSVFSHPGANAPIEVHLSSPPGTMTAEVKTVHGGGGQAGRNSALSSVDMGLITGGPIGGLLLAIGTAQAVHNRGTVTIEKNVRQGVMVVPSEPTLDLYRPLTPEERSIPLDKQDAILQEEAGLIVAIRDGHPYTKNCEYKHCYKVLQTYKNGAEPSWYDFLPENASLISIGNGGIQFFDKDAAKQVPHGLAVGDNGFINFGIDSLSGWADVLPGVLPDNAYWSQEKMADLIKRDPAAAHWYAVFNTPVPGGKPGDVVWTVMHQGKVVGTGKIVLAH